MRINGSKDVVPTVTKRMRSLLDGLDVFAVMSIVLTERYSRRTLPWLLGIPANEFSGSSCANASYKPAP